MASAIENLMKMMGVNPDEIKNQVELASQKFNTVVKHFNDRADAQDKMLTEILSLLKQEK